MLDLLGAEYAVRQCLTAYNQRKREEAYWVYVTDCLSSIAKWCGANVSKRFYDIINPAPVETKGADEIVNELAKKMGLKEV